LKYITFLIVILLCSTPVISAAEEGPRTGTQLLEYCKDAIDVTDHDGHDYLNAGFCMGYINGIAENTVFLQDTLKKPLFCIPNEVTLGQEIMVVVKFLEDHPENLNQKSLYLAMEALFRAFPCKK